jgi:ABC-type sugar transport system permease subunit
MRIEKRRNLFIFLAPTLFFTLVFIAFPLFYSGYLSLCEYNYATDSGPKFIGLTGYIDTISHDQFFHDALINQIKFAIPYFVITFLTSLILAILINELTHGVHFFQVIFYLPMVIPLSLVGVIFAWLLFPDIGIFNHFLRILGIHQWNIDWFGTPGTALYGLVIAQAWKNVGFTLIILLAGLQGIPKSIREAAKVDGAGFMREVWSIILPSLKPYLFISSVWVLINSMKVFDLPKVVTGGGPGTSTLTLYFYSWKLAFERLQMGRASQVAYITAAIILLLAWGLNHLFRTETAKKA